MSIFRLSSEAATKNSVDASICIVGAGLAGLLAARRMAKGGRRVVIVESGGDPEAGDVNGLNEIDDLFRRYTRATNGRHRGFGGTSSRWGGRMIPLGKHDTSDRPNVSLQGWPFPTETLSEYEVEIEALFGIAPGSFEDIPSERGRATRSFPIDEASLTPRWAKCPSFKRCNIGALLYDELRVSHLVEIWLGATVCGFELDRGAGRLAKITARNLNGHEISVRAENFIFAAGTIETTRLLLLLDATSDNRAFERCNVLGRYFQDHLKAKVATIKRPDPVMTNRLFGYRFVGGTRRDLHLELSRAAQERDGAASGFAYVAMNLAESPVANLKWIMQGLQRREPDIQALGRAARNLGLLAKVAWWRYVDRQFFVPAAVELGLMACVEQLPQWENRIRLSHTRDRLGSPMALLEWEPTHRDERTFRSLIRNIEAYWARAGFNQICPLEWSGATRNPSVPVIAGAEACAHPSGSTRMGTDPEQSVVGPDLRCHAVPNVAVVSASVFPSAGSANPTFTIMKLALWLADSYLRATVALEPAAISVPV